MVFKTLLVIIVIGLAVYGGVDIYNENNGDDEDIEIYYQGPVPIGYDLEHFRKTGETILNNG